MKLKNVSFDKYKTVNKGNLDVEKDITCLIGMNESGKSNLLTGLEKLDVNQSFTALDIARHSDEYTSEDSTPSAKFTFCLEDDDKSKLIDILGLNKSDPIEELVLKKVSSEVIILYPAINPDRSICKTELIEAKTPDADNSRPEGVSESAEEPTDGEDNESTVTESTDVEEITVEEREVVAEIQKQVTQLMPRLRYFDSVNIDGYFLPTDGVVSIKKLVENPEKIKPVANLLHLAEVDATSLLQYKTSNEKTRRDTILKRGSERLNKKLLRAFWPIDAVELQLKAEEDALKIRVVDNEDFAPGERSRGIQWALAFNIFFLAECDGDLKNTVLLIDEPGVFLHIDAQVRMLQSTFRSITDLGNQIVYSTHLPFLINKRFPQQLRILNKPSNSTEIGNKAWSRGDFGSIPEPARSALGINFDDVFMFGDFNLVVEGPSDQIYLNSVMQKLKPKLADRVTIVPSYGKENVGKVIAMSVLANKPCFALVDADFDLDKLKEKLGVEFESLANRVKKINEIAKDENISSTEDLLPAKSIGDALARLYNRIRSRDKIETPFKIQRPYVENAETALTKIFKAKQHKLLKTDLSREVSDSFQKERPKTEELKYAKAVIKAIEDLLKASNGST